MAHVEPFSRDGGGMLEENIAKQLGGSPDPQTATGHRTLIYDLATGLITSFSVRIIGGILVRFVIYVALAASCLSTPSQSATLSLEGRVYIRDLDLYIPAVYSGQRDQQTSDTRAKLISIFRARLVKIDV
jgi:hypothetical protein